MDRQRAARGTGTALKAYQRLWCLERGITGVRWTFDALQARNARLNMGRLGAGWASFHVDYYGVLRDGLNRDTGSDRLLLHWDLSRTAADRDAQRPAEVTHTLLSVGPAGEPVLGAVPTAPTRLEIPTDIDALRASAGPGTRTVTAADAQSGRATRHSPSGGATPCARCCRD